MTLEELKALRGHLASAWAKRPDSSETANAQEELSAALLELADELLALIDGSVRFVKARGEFYMTGKMSDPEGASAFDTALAALLAKMGER